MMCNWNKLKWWEKALFISMWVIIEAPYWLKSKLSKDGNSHE
jgi:hypothetical protein